MTANTPTLLDLLLDATPEQLDAVYAILTGETAPECPGCTDPACVPCDLPAPLTEDMTGPPPREAQMVTVYGPNLSAKGQRMGDLHVHATGCQHGKQYGTGRPMGGDDDGGWTIDVVTKLEATVECYPPEDHDYDVNNADDVAVYLQSIYFAPCLDNLPEA